MLAWTTTPWTLPGNVGLAVGEKIDYIEVEIKESGEHLILAKDRLSVLKEQQYSIAKTFKGKELLGLEYEPLYPFLAENVTGVEKEKLKNAYKVYAADFVTTTDGTGIVHTAVMYGQDDFELGTKVGLPKYHLVNEDGTFKKEVGFLAGRFVKDANTDVEIIKDLAHRQPVSLLFDKEKYEHSYPFCWRCHTPLIYFARDSWYVKMSDLRKKLVKENEGIHWEPEHIKEGRFGEWLREVKDWAISRERYWGTPLPIWNCEKCHKIKVVGSIEEVSRKPRNDYFVMRHGEAENNVQNILNNKEQNRFHLTELGKKQVTEAGEKFKKQLKGKKVDFIFVSPLLRTQETAKIMAEKLGIDAKSVITDDRLHEYGMGELDGKPLQELVEKFPDNTRFDKWPNGGESHADVKKRTGDVLYELEKKYEGKTILIITHENPACLLVAAAKGYDRTETNAMIGTRQGAFLNAELRKLDFIVLSHNREYELDLHKPYIDEVKLDCDCGGKMNRAKEVMDVWFDSGSMPFAEDHYPFENKKYIDKTGYPADFISEAIDQTRGWFYTLHAIGVLMGKGKAYKNVICLGHILDAEGKKMSKSIGNVVNPWDMMDKYGVDALRFWMYSVNQPGDSKNFEEKTVEEIVKKVFNMTLNVLAFYQLYSPSAKKSTSDSASTHVLDKWIISRLDQLIQTVTEGLDGYKFFEPTRAVKDFIADLSQWYLRRSRDRFKGEDQNDKNAALVTTRYVLLALGKVMAPFTPFFAEYLYGELGGEKESVHLEDWPKAGKSDEVLLENMENVRKISSLALEARMNAKINVRQPLRLLKIKAKQPKGFGPEFIDLVKDEVNVKEVVFDLSLGRDVEIDTTLTPELKEEGGLRELIRAIQDLRKEKGFTVNDRIILKVEADAKAKEFVEKFQNELAKATLLQDITFENDLQLAVMVVIGDLTMKIAI